MSSVDSVSQFTADSFSNVRIGVVRAVTLNTATANAYVVPILSGGLTNANAVVGSGSVIIRRITVQNPSGSLASAYISVGQNSSNGVLLTANTALSSISAAGTYQDITISGNAVVSGYNTSALYVNVNVVAGNSNTCDITVWGDVVSF